MKLGKIIQWIEKLAPLGLQESYDNSGLVLGDVTQDVVRLVVCLDVSEKAMIFAKEHGADLIISHHPCIFKPLKAILPSTAEGSLMYKAIKDDISLYSAHTNFDSVQGGVGDILCSQLGLQSVRVLKPEKPDCPDNGFGRVGSYDTALATDAFLGILKKKLDIKIARTVGRKPDTIKKVAVYNGSYDRSILPEVMKEKPDVLVTGDLKYHDALELQFNGIYTVDAGHYKTEIVFVKAFTKMLGEAFTEIEVLAFQGEDVFCTFEL